MFTLIFLLHGWQNGFLILLVTVQKNMTWYTDFTFCYLVTGLGPTMQESWSNLFYIIPVKKEKNAWYVYNCIRCIIKYILIGENFPLWVGINKNEILLLQFQMFDDWKKFPDLLLALSISILVFPPLPTYLRCQVLHLCISMTVTWFSGW